MPKKSTKKSAAPAAVTNRRARYDYELSDDIVAGIQLSGPEVRAARDGHVHLKGAFVTLRDGELWLNNASFSVKINERGKTGQNSVDTRARKLLVKRRDIDRLAAEKAKKGMSIVPTKLLSGGNYIKVVIALGKGKKEYDKRQTIKKRQNDREARAQMKRY